MIEHKVAAAEVRIVDEEQGEVEAIVSVTNIVDDVGDRILPGAYRRTLGERMPKMCWAHDWKTPVGAVVAAAELMPGDPRLPAHLQAKGAGALWIRGRFNLATQRGREAWEDVKFYSALGQCEWSIGYDCSTPHGKARRNPELGCRDIEELTLFECSPVLFGAAGLGLTSTLAVKELDEEPEDKRAVRRVRTPEGARRYGLPIGAPIVASEIVRTSDVEEAARALAAGKYVVLRQPRQVSTLLDRLAQMVAEAEAKGDKAPNIDLCKVSVKGTNLFCVESKGIPRIRMPQLLGKPKPGSPADKLPKNEKGEVDLSEAFRDHLREQGIGFTDTTEKAAYLRASQAELNGAKVAGMTKALRAGKLPPARIFVSADNYVVDGHHRWAANVAVDADDGRLGDEPMPVTRIDADIITVLRMANEFAERMGIPQAGFKRAFAAEVKVDTPGVADTPARRLRRWYVRGEGAARIMWGVPGDFMRCVAIAGRHMTLERAKGFCALRHHEALGVWPGREHGKKKTLAPGDDLAEAWERAKIAVRDLDDSAIADLTADDEDPIGDLPEDVRAWVGSLALPDTEERDTGTEEKAMDVKREFSRERREELAQEGAAMPDGSFPIVTVEDLRNAIRAIGRAGPKGSRRYEEVRRHIVRRARALGATDELPEDWRDEKMWHGGCQGCGGGHSAVPSTGVAYEDVVEAVGDAIDEWVAEALPNHDLVTWIERTYPDHVVAYVGSPDGTGERWKVAYRWVGDSIELELPEVVEVTRGEAAPVPSGQGEQPEGGYVQLDRRYVLQALQHKGASRIRRRLWMLHRAGVDVPGFEPPKVPEGKSLAAALAESTAEPVPDPLVAHTARLLTALRERANGIKVADLAERLERVLEAACEAGLLVDEERGPLSVPKVDPLIAEFESVRLSL